MRFAAQQSGDKTLYPGNSNPELSYKIDSLIDLYTNDFGKFAPVFVTIVPNYYENFDKVFTNFITKEWEPFLARLDKHLEGKYLFGNNFTIADAYVSSFFFLSSHNEQFEHNMILKALLAKHPRVEAWIDGIAYEFRDYFARPENKRPF